MSTAGATRARPVPLDRARALLTPGVLLGAAVAVVALVLTVVGAGSAIYQPDEAVYVSVAQYVAHAGVGGLFEWTVYQRGIQRLTAWLLAPGFAVSDAPGAFVIGHAVQALLFASALIPVYLLARGLGLKRRLAVAPAAVAILVPWAVVTSTFLTEPAAYAVFAWFLYLCWRALTRPSPGNDGLGLLATALAPLSRTGFVVLLPVLPLAAVLASRRGLWRQHKVLVIGTAIAVALVLARVATGGGWSSLTGSYGSPPLSDLGLVLRKDLTFLSRLFSGTGLLLGVVALPWLATGLVRRGDPARHAFSLLAVLSAGAILVQLAGAAPDERYVMYLAIPVAIAGCVAVARRKVDPAGLAAGTVAVAALVLGESRNLNGGDYAFFAYPAEAFHQRVLAGRLSVPPLSSLPGSPEQSLVALLVVAVALAWYALRARRWPVAVVLLVLVGWQAVQTVYVVDQFRAHVANPGHISADRLSFVDRATPDGELAGILASGPGNTTDFNAVWREAEFWNSQLRAVVQLGPTTQAAAPITRVHPVVLQQDFRTGNVRVIQGRLPHLLVTPAGVPKLGLRRQPVSQSYLPVELVRVREPLRADYMIAGMEDDGWAKPGQPVRIRLFAGARERGACAKLTVAGPPQMKGGAPYTVRGGGVRVRGALREGQTRTLTLRLPSAGRPRTDVVVLASRSVPYPVDRTVALQIAGLAFGPCA